MASSFGLRSGLALFANPYALPFRCFNMAP